MTTARKQKSVVKKADYIDHAINYAIVFALIFFVASVFYLSINAYTVLVFRLISSWMVWVVVGCCLMRIFMIEFYHVESRERLLEYFGLFVGVIVALMLVVFTITADPNLYGIFQQISF